MRAALVATKEGLMIRFEMTEEEAIVVQTVIERYLYHLQVEIMHTDRREFRDALKEREQFLKKIIERLKSENLAART
jgi:hypothetical protein